MYSQRGEMNSVNKANRSSISWYLQLRSFFFEVGWFQMFFCFFFFQEHASNNSHLHRADREQDRESQKQWCDRFFGWSTQWLPYHLQVKK
jgi:hypothetical protein